MMFRMRRVSWCWILLLTTAALTVVNSAPIAETAGEDGIANVQQDSNSNNEFHSVRRKTIRGASSNEELQRILEDDMPVRKSPETTSTTKETMRLSASDFEVNPPPPPPPSSPSPTPAPGGDDEESKERANNGRYSPGQLTMGVYYYPWHADDFHRGYGYIRKSLSPPQQPMLGEYDDRDPAVVWQHLQWSRQANIRLWVTSWWGPGSREDNTIRNTILPHDGLQDHQIALFYETDNRIKSQSDDNKLGNIQSDIEHMCTHYFQHPNYYRIDDKPVLFIYLTRVLSRDGLLTDVAELMRSTAASACNVDLYLIGDQVFGKSTNKDFWNDDLVRPFVDLDGVTNYDIYGSVSDVVGRKGGSVTEEEVEYYYGREQKLWSIVANAFGCRYIPAISPGYNDVTVRSGNPPLSRSLQGQEEGSLLRTALREAIPLTDDKTQRLLMINSFNEWHEDTQLEPVRVVQNPTDQPYTITNGISYTGYGDLYLEILRQGSETQMSGN
eukprot:scaffold21_cov107-Cylindrotheca_fusiformis.AAC.9